jgi:hypothetical protein
VALDAPAAATTADVVLYLYELGDLPPARGDQRPPIQVQLRYLVTTWGADARKNLGDLLFAALQQPDYDVRFPDGMSAYWSAVGIAPRPSFVLAVSARQDMDLAPAPPVRSGLTLQSVGAQQLEGIVLGPADVQIADAFIEIPALGLTTRSDTRGRFRFAAVPASSSALSLRVRAKAQDFPFTVDPSAPQPVTLRLDLAKG